MNPFEKIFSELQKAEIQYLIVGGVAVNMYGYTRITGDIDILLSLDEENLQKMDTLMKKMGYSSRIPANITKLADRNQVDEWIKEKHLKAYCYVPSKHVQMEIDVIIEESLEFDKLYENRCLKKMKNLTLPVIGLDELLQMKKKASRQRDLEDIAALTDLQKL